MTYDVHAHCVPSGLVDLLRRHGDRFGVEIVTTDKGDAAVLDGRALPPFRGILSDMDARLAAMNATGVDVQLLSSWIDLTAYSLDAAGSPAYSRLVNEALVAEAALHPDRFRPLGTVPLQNPRGAAEELRHAVEELGMVGVQIATTVDGAALDAAGLDPFWEAAEALSAVIVIHPCNPLAGLDLTRNFLDNMVGRPAETSIAVGRLLFGGVLERYPGLVVCVVHGGGFVPYQLGRMQRGFEAAPHMTSAHITTAPHELAARLYYDTVLHDSTALGFLVEKMGADHVVMGTDYPFEMGDPTPVATVEAIPGLTDDQRRQITTGNVERLLAAVGG